jgi:pimeloyl-ACP methyl ester carboxylesterase
MQFVNTRAGKVAYESQGVGPPLVLLHSAGHDHHDFDAVIPALSQRFRTIAIDWPGCGQSESPNPPSSASAELMCDTLEDIVEGLKLEPAIFVGNSIGGTAAIRLAGRRAERVRGLVPVNSGGFTRKSATARVFCWVQGREWVRRTTGLRFARAYMTRRSPHVDEVLARVQASLSNPAGIAVHAALWRSFSGRGNDVTLEASKVRCPTLVVWGREDPVVPSGKDGKRAREMLPGARYVELDTGHVPFAEDPKAFLEAVLPFLDSLSSTSGFTSAPGVAS